MHVSAALRSKPRLPKKLWYVGNINSCSWFVSWAKEYSLIYMYSS